MLGLNRIRSFLQYRKYKKQWQQANSHNLVVPVNQPPIDKIHIGKQTYGPLDVMFSNKENHLYIGNYCSLAANVKFLPSGDHPTNRISTYPFRTHCISGELEALSKGDIVVDDDVWIGYGSIILSGVHIGQGAVVAAGAVVNKDVPPYAIVGGVPAKVIRYRFSPELIEQLLKLDYSQLDLDTIRKHEQELYEALERPEQLDWFPKKP